MIKHERWHLLVAFGLGALCVIVPSVVIGILASLDKMLPSYYMYLILVPVGIFAIVRGFMFLADNRNIKMLETQGVRIKGKYISHGTNQGDRAPKYYVRYSFENENGETVLATSPAQYTWEQALAFRAAQEFAVLYKNGKHMIGEDAARLFEEHFNEVNDLKKAYNEAFNIVYRDMIEEAARSQKRRRNAEEADGAEQGAEESQGVEEVLDEAQNGEENSGEAQGGEESAEGADSAEETPEEGGASRRTDPERTQEGAESLRGGGEE